MNERGKNWAARLGLLSGLVAPLAGCGDDASPPANMQAAGAAGASGGGVSTTGGSGGDVTGAGGAGVSTGGGAGGEVGVGGAAGDGTVVGMDAATVPPIDASGGGATDAASDARVAVRDAAVVPDAGALVECPGPSVDRIQMWDATMEGTTIPMTGSLLVKEGDHYVAKEQFVGGGWHVMEILIANTFNSQVDLSKSAGFTLTYSTTADLWMQMRPGSHYSGGDKYVTKIPSSGGQVKQQFFPFTESSWTTVPELGKPTYSYADAIKEVRGFLPVGNAANTIVISGFRIDGYTPPCR